MHGSLNLFMQFKISGKWSVQANNQTYTAGQWTNASVGAGAQAHHSSLCRLEPDPGSITWRVWFIHVEPYCITRP